MYYRLSCPRNKWRTFAGLEGPKVALCATPGSCRSNCVSFLARKFPGSEVVEELASLFWQAISCVASPCWKNGSHGEVVVQAASVSWYESSFVASPFWRNWRAFPVLWLPLECGGQRRNSSRCRRCPGSDTFLEGSADFPAWKVPMAPLKLL